MGLITETFGQGGELTVAQECLRAVVIFAIAFTSTGVADRLGKRPLNRDLLFWGLVACIMAVALSGGPPFLTTMSALSGLIGVYWLIRAFGDR